MTDEPRPDLEEDDSAAARRRRAEEIHEEIERLKTGGAAESGEEPSPREFTDRRAREEVDGEEDEGPA